MIKHKYPIWQQIFPLLLQEESCWPYEFRCWHSPPPVPQLRNHPDFYTTVLSRTFYHCKQIHCIIVTFKTCTKHLKTPLKLIRIACGIRQLWKKHFHLRTTEQGYNPQWCWIPMDESDSHLSSRRVEQDSKLNTVWCLMTARAILKFSQYSSSAPLLISASKTSLSPAAISHALWIPIPLQFFKWSHPAGIHICLNWAKWSVKQFRISHKSKTLPSAFIEFLTITYTYRKK